MGMARVRSVTSSLPSPPPQEGKDMGGGIFGGEVVTCVVNKTRYLASPSATLGDLDASGPVVLGATSEQRAYDYECAPTLPHRGRTSYEHLSVAKVTRIKRFIPEKSWILFLILSRYAE